MLSLGIRNGFAADEDGSSAPSLLSEVNRMESAKNRTLALEGPPSESAVGPGCVKTLAIFPCDGPVGLDDLSGCILRFCRFASLTGSGGPDFAVPSGDLAGYGRK